MYSYSDQAVMTTAYLLHAHHYDYLPYQVLAIRKYLPWIGKIVVVQGPHHGGFFDCKVRLTQEGADYLGVTIREFNYVLRGGAFARQQEIIKEILATTEGMRLILQGDCIPDKPIIQEDLLQGHPSAARAHQFNKETILDWTWILTSATTIKEVTADCHNWGFRIDNEALHIEYCEPGFWHLDKVSPGHLLEEKLALVKDRFGVLPDPLLETAPINPTPCEQPAIASPSLPPPTEEEQTEANRREKICRGCDKWDSVKDGCSLLKPCDRYGLTRVYWRRGNCRLGRWLPHSGTQIQEPYKEKPVAPIPLADPNRQSCPSCDIPYSRPETIEEVYAVAEQIITSDLEPPKFDLDRCIVTSGEGKYEPGIVIGIKLLRDHIGCQLPVKIFHNGNWETDLSKYDVELINTRELQSTHPAKRFGGWESKTYAVVHANAKKVMFLDADAYLVNDPTPLFDLLDEHRYVLWTDFGPGWACGARLDNQSEPLVHQNGGEYLVNLETYWSEMVAARWLDNWGEVWYRTGRLGDECTTRLIRSIIQDRGVFRADWVDRKRGVGILCRYPAYGPAYVAHRMRKESKLFLDQYPNSCSSWPYEKEVLDYFNEMLPDVRKSKMRAKYLKTREGRIEARKRLLAEVKAKKARKSRRTV